MAERSLASFSPFTGRRCPEGADEGRRQPLRRSALPLICLPTSSPREWGEGGCTTARLLTIGGQP
ncbi:MAG: hypothetical protein EOS54_19630 [Mesorhizobium sp.]|nr:hypothetical protein EOA33_14805 [Mesorhizobium sp. M4A.F.Ca.ET.050.02.1.1]RVC42394.1 hypothetical protein EN781_22455 [Mesorhizobium sp. M4A.F.Ca.ET.090.04.2.1]RVD35161.1 hypothetical protein EN742_25675 [Mesorhizobium sp. M4A.F.Ca.ET.020.02.1.1]RWC13591.1 MAG: hypothetical protein EOS53_24105 [Mesorhizobium sp.]RWC51418.1 MAG: hypothetical protein EOS54_19630 [Mesorhizobium sp.]